MAYVIDPFTGCLTSAGGSGSGNATVPNNGAPYGSPQGFVDAAVEGALASGSVLYVGTTAVQRLCSEGDYNVYTQDPQIQEVFFAAPLIGPFVGQLYFYDSPITSLPDVSEVTDYTGFIEYLNNQLSSAVQDAFFIQLAASLAAAELVSGSGSIYIHNQPELPTSASDSARADLVSLGIDLQIS